MIRCRIILLAVSFCLAASTASASHTAPEVRAGMINATDLMLNLDADAAEKECQDLLAHPQGEAVGRFCLAMVTLTRTEDLDDPAPALDRFLPQVQSAIAAAEALERSQPTDAEVKLLLGLAQGSKALVDGDRKSYLAAFRFLKRKRPRKGDAASNTITSMIHQ